MLTDLQPPATRVVAFLANRAGVDDMLTLSVDEFALQCRLPLATADAALDGLCRAGVLSNAGGVVHAPIVTEPRSNLLPVDYVLDWTRLASVLDLQFLYERDGA